MSVEIIEIKKNVNLDEFPEGLRKCPHCGSENLLTHPIGDARTGRWVCAVYCGKCGRTFTEDGKQIRPDETTREDLKNRR